MMGNGTKRLTAGLLARALILLGLIPALVLASTQVAEAATYGPTVTGSVHLDGSDWHPYDSYDCAVAAHYVITGTNETVAGKVACTGQWNSIFASALGQGGSHGTGTLTFNGTDVVSGGSCSVSGIWDWTADNKNAQKPFTTTLWPRGCGVGELCMTVVSVMGVPGLPQDTLSNDECIPFVMGTPPTAEGGTGTCSYGTVDSPSYVANEYTSGGSTRSAYATLLHPVAGYNNGSTLWVQYLVFSDGKIGGNSNTPGFTSPNHVWASLVDVGTGLYAQARWYRLPDTWGGVHVVGWGMYPSTSNPTPTTPQTGTGSQLVGVTNPAVCAFYWGEKVANVTGSDVDEPIGALPGGSGATEPTDNAGPPTGDTGCGFSLGSPSTWASAGMCEAVGLLGSIARLLGSILNKLGDLLAAVGGLAADIASAIVGALGSLLNDLFVPSDGYLDSTLNGMKDDWNDTSPGAYMTGLGDAIPALPSGAGCSGVPVDFTLGLAGHTQAVDFDLGAACSGDTLHSAAGIVKTVLSAFLLVGAAWACVRYVVGAIYPSVLVSGREGVGQ